MLSEVAQRMRAAVRAIDTVARLGGDEFAMILPFLDEPATAEELAKRLIAAIGQPLRIGEKSCSVGVSIGIAIFPQDAQTVEELLGKADIALYAAKRAGRNTYRYAPVADHERLLNSSR